MSRLPFMLLALIPATAFAHPRTDSLVASGAGLQTAQRCTPLAGPAAGALSGRMPIVLTRCASAHDASLVRDGQAVIRSAGRTERSHG
jgi:hypothetical protein